MIRPVICLTLYRRPQFTRELLERLSQCYGIEDIPVYISCDYDPALSFQCDEVYSIAREWLMENGRSSATLYRNNPKKGIDLNKTFIIPKAFESGNYVIFFEDDTPMSKDCLQYFVAMGEMFEQDKSVLSVTSYNRITNELIYNETRLTAPYSVARRKGFKPWGWSMWKDRWDILFANDAERYKEETGNEANGLFDHNLHAQQGYYIYPLLPRSNHAAWENAEHTPSRQFLLENEFSPFGAWNEEMPDATGADWQEAPRVQDDAGLVYEGALGTR